MPRPFFELAKEGNNLKAVEGDLTSLEAALADSADFRDLITSPVYTRDEQGAGVSAIAKQMKLSPTVTNVLSLMAQKRRLFALPQLVAALGPQLLRTKVR